MLWLRVGAVLTLHFTDQGQPIKRGHWALRSQAVPGGPKAAPRRELWAEEQAPDCRVTLDKSLVFLGWFLPGLGFEGTQKMLAREELGKALVRFREVTGGRGRTGLGVGWRRHREDGTRP